MEDPDADWDIEGYSTEGSGNKCVILNKGLTLGKRVLVTGFVLSSAPVVIPSLAVVSALGIVVSVPFGLYLAGYTCTEKLMSKLLSTPLSYPSLLDNGNVAYVGEEFSTIRDEEKDEEEWMEDTLERIEMRLELDEKIRKEEHADGLFSLKNGYGQDIATEIIKEKEKEKGEMNEEDVGGGKLVQNLPESSEVNAEGLRPKDEEDRVLESREEDPQLVYGAVINVIEGDERRLSNPREAIDFPIEVTTVIGESTCLPRETSSGVEDFRKETTRLIEKIRDEGKSEELAEDSNRFASEMRQDVEQDDCQASNSAGQFEIPSKDKRGAINELANANEISREEKRSTMENEVGHDGARIFTDKANHLQGGQSQEDSATIVLSNADARVTGDVSGLQLSDVKIEGSREPIEKMYDPLQQYEEKPSNLSDESADALEIPVSTDIPQPGEPMNVPPNMNAVTLGKGILSEEKIWEQINAVKIIVGYKADAHQTCLEELRALYVFTGVQPPASFNDASDLQDINDKLLFLMSIVGVK